MQRRQDFVEMEEAKRNTYGLKGETPLGFTEDDRKHEKKKKNNKNKNKKQLDM